MMMTMIMKMMMIRRPTETLKLLLGEPICCLFWRIYVHLGSREIFFSVRGDQRDVINWVLRLLKYACSQKVFRGTISSL